MKMLRKIDLIKSNLDKLMRDHEEYTFFRFLEKIRKAYAISRVQAAKEMDLNYQLYYYWESGDYYHRRYPSLNDLETMATYFDVPFTLLLEKLHELQKQNHDYHFLDDMRNPQSDKPMHGKPLS